MQLPNCRQQFGKVVHFYRMQLANSRGDKSFQVKAGKPKGCAGAEHRVWQSHVQLLFTVEGATLDPNAAG
ncbi:hypothetical protein TNCV_908971 [Trichonephila clavipes]|nr:hypothetical protein TNCV_908971 [Trichonephila clavipes]